MAMLIKHKSLLLHIITLSSLLLWTSGCSPSFSGINQLGDVFDFQDESNDGNSAIAYTRPDQDSNEYNDNSTKSIEHVFDSANAEELNKIDTERFQELEYFLSKQPPSYSIGDYYVLDNPDTTWTVSDIANGLITWTSDTGAIQRTYSNPILPALEWKSLSKGNGRRFISHREGQMFPLNLDSKFSFLSSVDTDTFPHKWQLYWKCSVHDKFNDLKTSVGVLETWKIVCGRDGRKELTYYYAPRVGYYVAVEIIGSGSKAVQRRHLRDYGNKAIAQVELNYNLVPNNKRDFVHNKFNPRAQQSKQSDITIDLQSNHTKIQSIDDGATAINTDSDIMMAQENESNPNQNQPQNAQQQYDVFANNTAQAVIPTLTLPPPILPEYDALAAYDLRPAPYSSNFNQNIDNARQSRSITDRITENGTPVAGNLSLNGSAIINSDIRETIDPATYNGIFPWNDVSSSQNQRQASQNAGIIPDPRANLPWQQNQPLATGITPNSIASDGERLPVWNNLARLQTPLIHLASYGSLEEANAGWVVLQQNNPNILRNMAPITYDATFDNKRIVRLYAYGSANQTDAELRCEQLRANGTYCDVTSSQQY